MECTKTVWGLACLRSASVVDGACQIKIKSRARRPESRPEW